MTETELPVGENEIMATGCSGVRAWIRMHSGVLILVSSLSSVILITLGAVVYQGINFAFEHVKLYTLENFLNGRVDSYGGYDAASSTS